MSKAGFFAYMLVCADGSFYAGWTTDPPRRLARHNAGLGARYTRSRLPVKLLHTWQFPSRREAMQFEHHLKTLSRPQKEALLQSLGVRI